MEVERAVELENEENGEREEKGVGRERLQRPSHFHPAAHHSLSFQGRQAPTYSDKDTDTEAASPFL